MARLHDLDKVSALTDLENELQLPDHGPRLVTVEQLRLEHHLHESHTGAVQVDQTPVQFGVAQAFPRILRKKLKMNLNIE